MEKIIKQEKVFKLYNNKKIMCDSINFAHARTLKNRLLFLEHMVQYKSRTGRTDPLTAGKVGRYTGFDGDF